LKKKIEHVALCLILLLVVSAFAAGPQIVESRFNRVLSKKLPAPSSRAIELHKSLFIADLHGDSLLWGRDLNERSTRGHVDIPRLIEGNVALQAFTIVTKSPSGLNIEENSSSAADDVTRLVVLQRRPRKTWTSLTERALDQAARLNEFTAHPNSRLFVIRSRNELEQFLALRERERGIVAGFLGVEGAHALDGDLANLDRLYNAGVRMMAPTHFFDNDIGGSAHGEGKGGLTEKGREWVRRMEAKRMMIDLAHASSQTFADVIAMATRPIVVSHTGVRGTCNNRRNLSDDQLHAVARTGGVVGIGYWETGVCGTNAAAIARAIRYAAGIVGVDHVALGSDFDGAITAPFDTTGLVLITDALLAAGFSESDIRKIMGENTLRLLRGALP
jgi:microsomal dipeptidase-like Zn-dependent dipeptidase